MQDDADVVTILAGKLFDPYTLAMETNRAIRVSRATGRVLDVVALDALNVDLGLGLEPGMGQVIDLRGLTVLPGFVDAHVHLFLHPHGKASWSEQVTKESLAERTVRATVHAKQTLLAGFTTVRDLGTEGAADADLALRKCISTGVIPGPRYFCASRAIVPTGSYGPKGVHVDREGVDGITGADTADGRDACVRTVRRHIGAGADWIKIYADYTVRSRMGDVSTEAIGAMNTFNDEELEALVGTAHMYGVKVAAHATHGKTIDKLVQLGVDSIEHGYRILTRDEKDTRSGADAERVVLRALARSKTMWVPTLGVFYTLAREPRGERTWAHAIEAFKAALEDGVDSIACGGDTGVFAHGTNALEMILMVRLGADWRKVLRWGTLGGWTCIRSMAWEGPKGAARLARLAGGTEEGLGDHDVPFGAIRRGFAADVIATCGDVAGDFEGAVSAESIRFVMKAGRVYKRDGRAVE